MRLSLTETGDQGLIGDLSETRVSARLTTMSDVELLARVIGGKDLAERLLGGQGDWDRDKIDQVTASGKTVRVNLDRPMRILIAYFTARAEHDVVYFKPDVYKRDDAVLVLLDGPFRIRIKDQRTED